MTPPTIAIVCTVRNPSPSFTTWVHHHCQLVDRLYIYLDSPTEADFSAVPADPAVCTSTGARKSDFSGPSGVMQRQCKNVLHALTKCVIDGIDWLIHIDSDELIYSPEQNLKKYFYQVDSKVSCVRFINHEAVSTYEAKNLFKEQKLFKKNQDFRMPDDAPPVDKDCLFLGYMNGKSAVRVEKCICPKGPHEFKVMDGEVILEEGICILHYMSATYNDWLKKCAELGDFPSFWRDDLQRPMNGTFLVLSRDIYRYAKQSGDWKMASDFYRRFLISESDAKELIKKGKLLSFDVFAENNKSSECNFHKDNYLNTISKVL
ncbi:glycosyltransferase family 2 protein [Actimicrobium sp. CCI2.3]|uniref:glycosyltransferase family 2 protein n=1 Tax=Actimicrobium sp. CCI2.3 TaxID=3048616 RepID=UPI002AB58308|nr:glycosyltransferase family 2 protein [Actimicrobium sp. CCI2.3]MDY7573700.1 glycosyltransferase family 2 protein [Actimicrobium sp. CCI2.3]MEB0021028.1 glycosyltransferase family 2 protein [Actimicrobium sp. CCI2.3]